MTYKKFTLVQPFRRSDLAAKKNRCSQESPASRRRLMVIKSKISAVTPFLTESLVPLSSQFGELIGCASRLVVVEQVSQSRLTPGFWGSNTFSKIVFSFDNASNRFA
jgi:hypothetical protein